MRTTKDEAQQAERAAEESSAPPKQSIEDRVAAIEAYVAFVKPRLTSIIGEEPAPPAPEEQPASGA